MDTEKLKESSADELLPLPEYLQQDLSHMSHEGMGEAAQAYARANVAHATAGLRAELDSFKKSAFDWHQSYDIQRERAERAEAELSAAREDAARLREALEIIASLSMSQFHKPQDLGNAAIKLAAAAMQEQK